MKTGIFLIALVQLAAAQPRNAQEKRQDVVTDVTYVTAYGPDVYVYVNAAGQPISTSTAYEAGNKAAPATITAAAAPTVAAAASKHHHKHHHKHNHAAAAPAAAPAAPAAAAPAIPPKHKQHHIASSGSAASSALGLVYSPYNSDNSCKTQDEVNSDFDQITGYGMVRIYGTDCDQITTVGNAAQAHGMKVFAGVFDLSDIAGDVAIIVEGFKNNWAAIDTINIGNELVNSGLASPAEVVAALNIARPILTAAGYTGSLVTVDTFNALIANPELCEASDYAAANAHAFFDPTCTAANAGSWAESTKAQVAQACSGKDVVITESGWPHQGEANGAAIPGYSEQAAAISSLKSHFSSGGLIVYTAYDDLWKVDTASTFGAEKYWGIYSGQ